MTRDTYLSTILSSDTSNSSLSRSGRLEMTMASLNSPRAFGRDAVRPSPDTIELRPWRGWKRSGSSSFDAALAVATSVSLDATCASACTFESLTTVSEGE